MKVSEEFGRRNPEDRMEEVAGSVGTERQAASWLRFVGGKSGGREDHVYAKGQDE